jgi:putative ATPase
VYEGEKKIGKGKGYKYPHDLPCGHVPQVYLAEGRKYYSPKDIGFEKKIKARMEEIRNK